MRSRINKRSSNKKKNVAENLKNKVSNIEIDYTFILKLIATILLYIILFFSFSGFCQRTYAAKQFEDSIDSFAKKNSDTLFEIKDVILYTSASAKSGSVQASMDISAFTDIAFYITNPKNKKIDSLVIDNIKVDPAPELGTTAINYKNPYDFGKLTNFDLESANSIEYKVIDERPYDYDNPQVYYNLNSPITLTYVNKDIYQNFRVRASETSVYYNGRLLDTSNVDITKLKASISFDITINKQYTCRLFLDIPYRTDKYSIIDGYVLQELSLNGTGKFYKL